MKLSFFKNACRDAARFAAGGLIALTLASCGGGGGSAGTVQNAPLAGTTPGSVSLLLSNTELNSAGVVGTEVAVTAIVKTPDNITLANSPVTFTASSGALVVTDLVTDKNGQAKATLGTSGDRTNRTITITVKAGSKTASGTVSVTGNVVKVAGPTTISLGATGEFVISVLDSSKLGTPGVPVTITSSLGNQITLKSTETDISGQIKATVLGTKAGSDFITAFAQGTNASQAFSVNSKNVSVVVANSAGSAAVSSVFTSTSCSKILPTYTDTGIGQSGSVSISTSRGKIYTDSSCLAPATTNLLTLVNGVPAALTGLWTKSDTIGEAIITASIIGGPSAQTPIRYSAVLTPSSTISLQTEPSVVGTNIAPAITEASKITAIVRDGTANNNLVAGAFVEFTILNDKSGGKLSSPAVVQTGDDGSIFVTYIAGPADTPAGGVEIKGTIQGTTISTTTLLTVAKRSLFITAGTANTVALVPGDVLYRKDFSVLVNDAAGNPVANATVTGSAYPTLYQKGVLTFDLTTKLWEKDNGVINLLPTNNVIYTCNNEDLNTSNLSLASNLNGILDPGEDFNGNGVLDPRIPFAITASGKTDATGFTTLSLTYPRDRAGWTQIQMIITGSVSGTESSYRPIKFFLPASINDLTSPTVPPPGKDSPYGTMPCATPG